MASNLDYEMVCWCNRCPSGRVISGAHHLYQAVVSEAYSSVLYVLDPDSKFASSHYPRITSVRCPKPQTNGYRGPMLQISRYSDFGSDATREFEHVTLINFFLATL